MGYPIVKMLWAGLVPVIVYAAFLHPPKQNRPEMNAPTTTIAVKALTPQEFLKTEIERVGLKERDFKIMREIIHCESGWQQFWRTDGNGHKAGDIVFSNGNAGLAQINVSAHKKEYTALELDPFQTNDNLRYAVILYQRRGIRDWEPWSGHCFLPRIKNL